MYIALLWFKTKVPSNNWIEKSVTISSNDGTVLGVKFWQPFNLFFGKPSLLMNRCCKDIAARIDDLEIIKYVGMVHYSRHKITWLCMWRIILAWHFWRNTSGCSRRWKLQARWRDKKCITTQRWESPTTDVFRRVAICHLFCLRRNVKRAQHLHSCFMTKPHHNIFLPFAPPTPTK